MSIITFDGNSMASDCSVYKYGVRVSTGEKKFFQFKAGNATFTVAFSGSQQDCHSLTAEFSLLMGMRQENTNADTFRLTADEKLDWVTMIDEFGVDEFDGMVVVNDGISKCCYNISANGVMLPIPYGKPYAIGGEDEFKVAMGALHAGATASEAVEICNKLLGTSDCRDGIYEVEC